jgi:hypothetical protein
MFNVWVAGTFRSGNLSQDLTVMASTSLRRESGFQQRFTSGEQKSSRGF